MKHYSIKASGIEKGRKYVSQSLENGYKTVKNFVHGKAISMTGKLVGNKVRQSLGRVSSNKKALLSASETVEDKFMKTIVSLERIEKLGGELENSCSGLQRMTEEGEDNAIAKGAGMLGPGLEFSRSSIKRIQSLIAGLDRFENKLKDVLVVEDSLDMAFGKLTYIRTLIRVNSSSLDQGVQVMLLALVDEIMHLQGNVSRVFKEKFYELNKTRSTVNSLKGRLESWVEQESEKGLEREAKIERMNRVVEGNLKLTEALCSVRDEVSNDIRDRTGNAVIAMQSHDIVSQKLSHIYENVEEMDTRFSKIAKGGKREETCRELRFIEASSSILKSQIDRIIEELRLTSTTINGSLTDILSIASNLESFGEDSQTKEEEQDVALVVKRILNSLKDQEEMFALTETISNRAFEEIRPIRDLASNITEVVMTLSIQLHLIGLNAEVQAARVGGSTGLEVLSSNISKVSKETGEICHQVSADLDVVIEDLIGLVDAFEELSLEGTREKEQLLEKTYDCEKELLLYEEQFNEISHRISGDIKGLKSFIEPLTRSTDFESLIIRELKTLEFNLLDLRASAKFQAENLGVEVDVEAVVAHLAERYTMEAERQVHQAAIEGNEDFESFDDFSTPERSDGGMEMFDDGLEMFDDSFDVAVDREQSPEVEKTDKRAVDKSIEGVDLWVD